MGIHPLKLADAVEFFVPNHGAVRSHVLLGSAALLQPPAQETDFSSTSSPFYFHHQTALAAIPQLLHWYILEFMDE